ncbi:MAG: DUF2461 domain-containing protein [Gammaproteobacteria bacterium]|nr:DUF2461 domain-containing protein [Gammaproteobacteria bacterium]
MGNFAGFGTATLGFLAELGDNNNRDWFQANKARYDTDVLEPALDFIVAVGDRLPTISRHLVAIPKRTGGSLMRVYRDTRFSKDKTPYKTNIGIQFRHEQAKDVHAPGLYFHLDNDECFLGVGMWHPERDALAAIRAAIMDNGASWKRVRDARPFRDVFELGGASLKRPPRGFPADHCYVDDLMRKDFIGTHRMAPGRAASPGLADEVFTLFAAGKGFMRFLCRALELPF